MGTICRCVADLRPALVAIEQHNILMPQVVLARVGLSDACGRLMEKIYPHLNQLNTRCVQLTGAALGW